MNKEAHSPEHAIALVEDDIQMEGYDIIKLNHASVHTCAYV